VTKYTLTKTEPAALADLKQQYLQQCSSALDGMWTHFTAAADHFAIVFDGKTVGYCIVNDEHKLLQFFAPTLNDARPAFKQVLDELDITGAFTATSEASYLALCMDQQKSVAVNALMYHLETDTHFEAAAFPSGSDFKCLKSTDLAQSVAFGVQTLGMDAGWLQGYFGGLIAGEKLYGLWQDGTLIATGECRPSDSQSPYADVGMIVSKNHRKLGIATNVLRQLLHICVGKSLKAICSTEADNVGAQKAIANAGFTSHHRILEVTF